MIIIGVDYHPSFQTIAFLMEETGEHGEQELNHSDGEAERFYRELKERGVGVRVGMDEQKRASYDAQLAASGTYTLHRAKTASQKTLEDCLLRATELLRAENYVGSVVWLRKCVDIAPDDAKYHALLARSLGTIPQYRNESIEHFERSIELDPWNAAVYVQLAELYEEMEQPWRARPLYSKILEINPHHAVARGRLSELDVERGSRNDIR